MQGDRAAGPGAHDQICGRGLTRGPAPAPFSPQGAKKLCPQCNTITAPGDLRRIYLCNPEIHVTPGVEHYVLDTSLDEVYFALQ